MYFAYSVLAPYLFWPSNTLAKPHPTNAAPSVRVENGLIIGTTTSLPSASATVNKFLGVPFAQSPPKRFSPPKAAVRKSTIEATAWKPACIQQINCELAQFCFIILGAHGDQIPWHPNNSSISFSIILNLRNLKTAFTSTFTHLRLLQPTRMVELFSSGSMVALWSLATLGNQYMTEANLLGTKT